MSTIRKYLANAKAEKVRIFYQAVEDGDYPGWSTERDPAVEIADDNCALLDLEFDGGYGCPMAPAVIAYDDTYVYIVVQYDGSTWMERIPRNPKYWEDRPSEPIPYPGG